MYKYLFHLGSIILLTTFSTSIKRNYLISSGYYPDKVDISQFQTLPVTYIFLLIIIHKTFSFEMKLWLLMTRKVYIRQYTLLKTI